VKFLLLKIFICAAISVILFTVQVASANPSQFPINADLIAACTAKDPNVDLTANFYGYKETASLIQVISGKRGNVIPTTLDGKFSGRNVVNGVVQVGFIKISDRAKSPIIDTQNELLATFVGYHPQTPRGIKFDVDYFLWVERPGARLVLNSFVLECANI